MNAAGHTAFGLLFYTIIATTIGHKITPTELLLVPIISMLPDIDVIFSYVWKNIKHRKYTHNIFFSAPLFILLLPLNPPLAFAFISHYFADYVYTDTLKKIIPVPSGNTVTRENYLENAALMFSSFYSILLLKMPNSWFSEASGIALSLITLVEIISKKRSN